MCRVNPAFCLPLISCLKYIKMIHLNICFYLFSTQSATESCSFHTLSWRNFNVANNAVDFLFKIFNVLCRFSLGFYGPILPSLLNKPTLPFRFQNPHIPVILWIGRLCLFTFYRASCPTPLQAWSIPCNVVAPFGKAQPCGPVLQCVVRTKTEWKVI